MAAQGVTKESLRRERAKFDGTNTWFAREMLFTAAARFVERLLPEECVNGQGDPNCVDGQLWDEGLVEVVAEALHDAPYNGCDSYQQMQVRAVLAALTAEAQR